ncbi:hypothetical protein EC973_003043 [Apophysomyces ossiformis]|uniref:F-box domain-containing protein n=1 Tax=Apophysomyces ossiformis TaxID=679940 RepID=A0A8H7ESZ3_9FUNG|nr:hypothetical protein EC973_003043 [Apophysomyces ossiformis]
MSLSFDKVIRALRLQDPTGERYLMEGRKAFDESRFHDAFALFSCAHELAPDNDEIIICRTATHKKLKELETVLERARKRESLGNRWIVSKKDEIMQGRRRKDFMAILPFDIIYHILSYLCFQQRLICLTVCSSWRALTLHWPGMWHELHFTPDCLPTELVKRENLGRYVERVLFSGPIDETKVKAVMQTFMQQQPWDHLKRLAIVKCMMPMAPFLSMLYGIGHHLTHLHLDRSVWDLALVFSHILSICLRLTHLSFRGFINYSNLLVTSSEASQQQQEEGWHENTSLSLVSLSLSAIHGTTLSKRHLSFLLRQCPELRYLQLTGDDSDILSLLKLASLHCPKLMAFHYSPVVFSTEEDNQCAENNNNDRDGVEPKEHGLTALAVPYVFGWKENEAVAIVQQHQQTLKHLDVRYCSALGSFFVRALADAQHLQRLNLTGSRFSESDYHFLFASCPSVECLSVADCMNITDSVLQRVATMLPRLKSLNISSCCKLTGPGIRRFVSIKHHHGDQLHSLIMDCPNEDKELIHYIKKQLPCRVYLGRR